ncbi:protein Bouncer-like [Thalassophryne amazonica]|uniref:protein Bouncer-like n=1 Tax=Thalassophryne amazonica TaxID=390379 RepID=UPI0014723E5D|nr:protein Bouncer-like [Thalassophryne amazonica]
MNNFLKAVLVLSACIAVAQSLNCYQCIINLLGSCGFTQSVVSCDNATSSCFLGNAHFNTTSAFTLHSRGCLDKDLCGKTLTGSILTAAYTSSFTCCDTDKCNGANSVQMSITGALSAAVLASLWGICNV